MAELLYLDTARLGRMSPSARRAQQDFIDMACAEGASLYFERFFRLGADDAAAATGEHYPGLARWKGVANLKCCLRSLAGSSPDLPVLLASRSAQLMKLAGRLLFHPCRNVLVTDLGWPGYHDILAAECQRASRVITTIAVREAILEQRVGEDALVRYVCTEFARHGCDGLFLTAVSNLGVRLPVERIVSTLRAAHQLWFVVIDGAQDFCHLPADRCHEYGDLYVAGSHKWMGAHHPMGIAFYGQRESRGFIETVLAHMIETGDLDDPLLRYGNRLEAGTLDGMNETVNLAPLFACHGAAIDARAADLSARFANVATIGSVAAEVGWKPLLPEPCFRSGILLLQALRPSTRESDPASLRASFYETGVALSAYDNGLIRLSMPQTPLQGVELELLRHALRTTA